MEFEESFWTWLFGDTMQNYGLLQKIYIPNIVLYFWF